MKYGKVIHKGKIKIENKRNIFPFHLQRYENYFNCTSKLTFLTVTLTVLK